MGHSPDRTHVSFKVVDGPFYNCPYLIERIPLIGIVLDTKEHSEIHVIISIISGKPFFRRYMALYNRKPTPHLLCGLSGRPIYPGRSVLFRGSVQYISCQECCHLDMWGAVNVIAAFFKRTFISRVIGGQNFGEVKIMPEGVISFYGVKRRVADGYILIRGIRLFPPAF